ncbi:MAG: LysR family transcriptional regulator [Rhodobacteraceae bacterium]|jgi:DNA-binding transcriptional LysR family regulator|nr:LysR family transcriptional regulator [Paracoccaceae bacterium]
MQTDPDWTDYAYFASIARHGGLQRAADDLGVSAATLSRRMRAFEVQVGRRLFRHGSDGYALTEDGRALWARTQRMEAVATEINLWREAASGPVCVRISAGTWTARDLAENLPEYWSPGQNWLPEFVHCDQMMDIARREIDIGIRNARPTQPWLAGQRVGTVQFAVYAAGPDVTGWIGPAHGATMTPSLKWLLANHGDEIVTKANCPQLACALAIAGMGRVVLPTFMGDRMPGLSRASETIEDLTSGQWLICHQDGRNEPAVRAALDALADYLMRRDAP